jgi:hypothetical protein
MSDLSTAWKISGLDWKLGWGEGRTFIANTWKTPECPRSPTQIFHVLCSYWCACKIISKRSKFFTNFASAVLCASYSYGQINDKIVGIKTLFHACTTVVTTTSTYLPQPK